MLKEAGTTTTMGTEKREIATARTIANIPSSMPAPESEKPPVVDGYKIERVLGRGGMGVVYKAVQTSLSRPVALKMILSENARGDELARFVSEAEAVARLQHPNIVQIYEIGETEGRPFFSLEYVDGGDLEKKIETRPLAWRDATKLLSVLARAIHEAHVQGIIHRDLKPANILLSSDGTPKITDFGIAKRLNASKQTQVGKIMGSPAYMAPEQATGRNDLVGPGTDIYALGSILYDMLTGRPPFQSDNTMDTLLQTITSEVIPPRLLQPKIPRDLNVICLKCLEKESGKRYSSALELSLDLDRLLRHEPIHARPIGQLERTQRWIRRNPAWGTLIAATILGTLGLAAAGAWFTAQLQEELQATELARKDATSARNEIRLRLVRSTADSIDSDLRQLANTPRVIASALQERSDWSEEQLKGWLRAEVLAEPQLFGMAVAFEPGQYKEGVDDFCIYAFEVKGGVKIKQLLPPDYTPLYREWAWYRDAVEGGAWSEPYVDDGGGDIPMTTYSMPFYRNGKKAGVVTADLSLEYFRSLEKSLSRSNFGGGSYAFIVNSQGTIVSHPRAEFRFPAPKARLTSQGKPDDWKAMRNGKSGSTWGVDIATGQAAELLFAPVKTADWSCIAVLPE